MTDTETVTGEVVKEVDVTAEQHQRFDCLQHVPKEITHQTRQEGTYKLVRVSEE